ncbi:UPF0553 protein C9orf64 [Trachymyrmex cornetzi]|uniref:Queuosine 5'-phosphate N-glycosylase/hydrolase n=1 Tax=Trachymyrmex cornetzi TaxID=471704 RepID=A0A195EGH3_9HYME|nr:UPF0553 protein C9orf64 [Trachymyrmex cornetzi]
MSRNYDNKNFNAVTRSYVRLSSEFHPDKDDNRAADWLFVLNTLNFALWTEKDMKEWKVDGLTGYVALCAVIKRAIDDGKSMWDPKFYTTLSMVEMIRIFQGDDDVTIPRLSQRLIILHEVGKVLLDHYNGTFANCIKSCEHDAMKLMVTIHDKFPSYHDVTKYGGRSVKLYTKAWTLVADIWAYFHLEHELWIEIKGIKYSTIFADYRMVQVFNHFNVLVYSKRFLDTLEKEDGIMLRHGDIEELEIRCCLIYAVQMVCDEVRKMCAEYKERMTAQNTRISHISTIVDNFIFHYQMKNSDYLMETVPFHYTKSTMY